MFFHESRRELMVPLNLRRGPQGTSCVTSGCRTVGPHLELRRETQGSFLVATWISGFLPSFNRGTEKQAMWNSDL